MTPPILPDEFNAATYFIDRHIAEGRGQKVAIECGERRVTYQQLFEMVNRTGNCLRKLGVRMEERVFLLLLDTPEFAASFFGAIKLGAVPVPINTLLKPADYKYLLHDSRARVAIVSEELLPLLKAIPRQELRFLETILVVGSEAWPGARNFADALSESSPNLEAVATSKDDAAFCCTPRAAQGGLRAACICSTTWS